MPPGAELTLAPEPEPETGFTIDGKIYPIPTLDSFTMDEAVVMYDYSGLTLEDFAPRDEEDESIDVDEWEAARAKKWKHPGLIKALLHVAYQRGNPKVKPVVVARLVSAANVIEALETTEAAEEGETPDPPEESTSELEQSSTTSLDDSSSSSGSDSESATAGPDDDPESTGPMSSGTSSPPSGPET